MGLYAIGGLDHKLRGGKQLQVGAGMSAWSPPSESARRSAQQSPAHLQSPPCLSPCRSRFSTQLRPAPPSFLPCPCIALILLFSLYLVVVLVSGCTVLSPLNPVLPRLLCQAQTPPHCPAQLTPTLKPVAPLAFPPKPPTQPITAWGWSLDKRCEGCQ